MKLPFRFPKIPIMSAAALGLVLLFTLGVRAQWPAPPVPENLRTAAGQPDMNGPAPRTFDGKPDFTGVWSATGPGGRGGDKGKDKGGPPDGKGKGKGKGPGAPPPGPGLVSGSKAKGGFKNMGAGMDVGSLPYQPWAKEVYDQRFAENSKDHPDAHCLPLNPVQLWFHPQPRKLIWSPKEIVLLAEANSGIRQIYTDGRALPNKDDVQPWWHGYSVGKWDGDTLVVESTGFLDNAWIDENGSPMTNNARVTERIRRPNFGTLEVEITVDDPKTYTKPWTVTANQTLLAGEELIEFICGENNTSVQHLVGK